MEKLNQLHSNNDVQSKLTLYFPTNPTLDLLLSCIIMKFNDIKFSLYKKKHPRKAKRVFISVKTVYKFYEKICG